jgi:hypothetical protein
MREPFGGGWRTGSHRAVAVPDDDLRVDVDDAAILGR